MDNLPWSIYLGNQAKIMNRRRSWQACCRSRSLVGVQKIIRSTIAEIGKYGSKARYFYILTFLCSTLHDAKLKVLPHLSSPLTCRARWAYEVDDVTSLSPVTCQWQPVTHFLVSTSSHCLSSVTRKSAVGSPFALITIYTFTPTLHHSVLHFYTALLYQHWQQCPSALPYDHEAFAIFKHCILLADFKDC